MKVEVVFLGGGRKVLEAAAPPGYDDLPRTAQLDVQAAWIEALLGPRWMELVTSWVEVP